jgi:hypothetical protein
MKIGYIDNSKYKEMIRKRPALNLLAKPNTRVLTNALGMNVFVTFVAVSIFGIVLYKQMLGLNATYIFDQRKQFTFEVDPFSNKVHCTWKDVPYTQDNR